MVVLVPLKATAPVVSVNTTLPLKLPETITILEKVKASKDKVLSFLGSATFQEKTDKGIDLFYLEEIFNYKPVLGGKLEKINLLRLSFNNKEELEKATWLELKNGYIFDPSKNNSASRYDLKFFDQIQKNFS
jgi:hypothetical protein